ncbi:MAG: response regulator transcription factor, partial [Syntrophales bacterium LBB04]|nr:response regulator transcription factor [Syntrophales bacterium LBB04]
MWNGEIPMRILIAEDDLTSRTVLARFLTKDGYEVTSAVNGAEAWRAMREPDAPAVAILDWMMPEMDGLEVVRRIRASKTQRQPYLIMLTARDEKSDIVAGLAAGADEYLAKPCDPSELHARINVGRRIIEMQDSLAARIKELNQALAEIKTLSGILPACGTCKKIRDDQGYWKGGESRM